MEFNVVDESNGVLRLEVVGRVVDHNAPESDEPLEPLLGDCGYGRKVLLSLERTTAINSMGVSWLIVSQRRFAEAGGRLVLHSVPPQIMETLMIMRLNTVLQLAEDETSALRMLQGEPP